MVQELEQNNLQDLTTNNETVVVQYSATWCGNCRIMKPNVVVGHGHAHTDTERTHTHTHARFSKSRDQLQGFGANCPGQIILRMPAAIVHNF